MAAESEAESKSDVDVNFSSVLKGLVWAFHILFFLDFCMGSKKDYYYSIGVKTALFCINVFFLGFKVFLFQ